MLINSSGRLFVESNFDEDVFIFSGVDTDTMPYDQLPAEGMCEEVSFPVKTVSASC